jgi:hypothetical protein
MIQLLPPLVLALFPVPQQRASTPPAHPVRTDPPRSGVVEAGRPLVAQPRVAGGATRRADRNASDEGTSQNETWISVDPTNPLNLVAGANDYRGGDAAGGVYASLDGGLTWTSSTLAMLDPIQAQYDAQGDPALAAYPGGVFYYAYIDFNRTDDQNRLCVARSSDGGLTWPQVGVVMDHSGPGSHDFEDKELIAVDTTGGAHDGNVYIAWTRFLAGGGNRIMLSRSTDGGATFSAPLQISDSTGGYQGTAPAVGPNGELYVAWHRGDIELDVSLDGGLTWGTDRFVAAVDNVPSPLPGASFRLNSFPALAVDTSGGPNNGNLYVVWADDSGTTGNPDVLLTRSTNGGTTWSPPIRVSDDTNGEYQWYPAIAVDSAGVVTVSFFDRRADPGSQLYDVYVTQSLDGGLSFRRNVKVSLETSNAALDGFGGAFIGDYSGLAVSRGRVTPCWTDTRPSNANAEAYVRPLRVAH